MGDFRRQISWNYENSVNLLQFLFLHHAWSELEVIVFLKKMVFYRGKIDWILAIVSWFDGKNSSNSNIVGRFRLKRLSNALISRNFAIFKFFPDFWRFYEVLGFLFWEFFTAMITLVYGSCLQNKRAQFSNCVRLKRLIVQPPCLKVKT